ncbi:threonylcarbamoyl-AMP synthase [Thermosipho ferrireducens]|uniref:Threonylcarbamoyl-AMP synthase n=1 Tax=Thermosipho ferrireducens TaxID=2571116 RepID=A0ABX7S5W4_9BACT|nr:L-threonylcarbamoyladenylate synthase [Thermosipho ferrireducens]QTA37105.1 threonylcarbamoyl-AMP synthase [Thermosipho ferrireducens]
METIVLKINPAHDFDITIPCEILKTGGLVAFPTETVYGLGATIYEQKAISKIFTVKGRPQDNPLIIHVGNINQLEKVGFLEKKYRKIVEKLTPGPITFVVKRKEIVPDIATAGLPTVGIRIPAHPVAQKLCLCAGPIAAPSANISGKPSPTDGKAVIEDLMNKIECIIDSGETPFGIESSIIDISKDKPILLRPGPITIETLKELFDDLEVPEFVKKAKSVTTPEAPGMKYRHYAPEKPLYLIENEKDIIDKINDLNAVVICPEEHAHLYPKNKVVILGSLKKPYTIAQNLFKTLRKIDKLDCDLAFVEAFEERGILFSVMNRLKKAAKKWG